MLRIFFLAVIMAMTLLTSVVQAASLFGPGVGWVDTVPQETATERWQINASFDLATAQNPNYGSFNASGFIDVERTRTSDVGQLVYDFDTEITSLSLNAQRPFTSDTQEVILSLNTSYGSNGIVSQAIPLAGGTNVAESAFQFYFDLQILTPIIDDGGMRTGTSILNIDALPLGLYSEILAYPPEGATYLGNSISFGEGEWHMDNISFVVMNSGPAPVPVPTSVWLFGSGLISLIGVARRKKA